MLYILIYKEIFAKAMILGTVNFFEAIKGKSELELTVKGRRSKKARSVTVWFFGNENKIYLIPVNGTDTEWYKNILKDPSITLTSGKTSIKTKAEPITEPDRVHKVVDLFAKKYARMGEINKYYKKLDTAIEAAMT